MGNLIAQEIIDALLDAFEKNGHWVLIEKAVSDTGYTQDAIRCKIRDGIWTFWKKKGGRIHINMLEYNKWISEPESERRQIQPLKLISGTRGVCAESGSSSSPPPLI